jgi:predicted nucleic acid-binding protein
MAIMRKREDNYFVDSNIFLRVLLRDDERSFNDCLKFLNKIKKGEANAFTSNLVLTEINWILLRIYKLQKSEIIEGLVSILSLKNLKIRDKFQPQLAIKIYNNFPVKFIDALIASNPKIYKKEAIVVSYDKDFDKIGVKRMEPKDFT